MNTYDIVIIGGGAAGMMAAISARHHHKEAAICIVDRTFELGRKILVAGAGRGNLTNANLDIDSTSHFHGNPQCIQEVFSQFDGKQIRSFFEAHGIPLYEEQKNDKGKLFPVMDNAKTVRDIIVDDLQQADIEIRVSTEVTAIVYKEGKWNVDTDKGMIIASDIILACGGSTYPALGANGSGYALAKSIGHTIVEPVPSAVPLVSKNMLSHFLQGEKVNMELYTKEGRSSIGEVLFTQYGISGPAVLDMSRDISVALHRNHQNNVVVYLSFFPKKNKNEIVEIIEKRFADYANRLMSRSLWGLFTVKTSNAICAVSDIGKDTIVQSLTDKEKQRLIQTLTQYEITITDTRGWNEAEFTSGGVVVEEIDMYTLASKKAPHVYMAGEVLDVDGDIGGYNLSWAWASGWVAGRCLT